MSGRAALLLAGIVSLFAATDVARATEGYIGSSACGACHAEELAAWHGSHHDLAMTEATEDTVRGDFDDIEFTAHGVTSRFYRKDGGYWVRTDGPDGQPADYPIAYTFGWEPLQQYLIRFPGGRLQALGIAWDTRAAAQGGQRWFHLYPDESDMDHTHPLHWTAPDQTWNYQCAECHSTRLQKGYDSATDTYETTWAEIDVGCESCHGPGADHRRQAEAAAGGDTDAWDEQKGLAPDLADRSGGVWQIDPATGLPRRSAPLSHRNELEVCARCHSRRGQLHEAPTPGGPLSDTHRLALLGEGLYYADGQILDEVFVHGSFLQSRMHEQGVICSDCHDPHTLALKQPGNAVCGHCHLPQRYDAVAHHHHPADAESGTACVDCHMPQRYYMVVDERADHSMRIPRPDLSVELGTPNACNQCHDDQSAQWAADAVAEWYGPQASERPQYASALHAARAGSHEAAVELAADADQPGIVRATAAELMADEPWPGDAMLIPRLASDPDPLVRAAAARYLEHVQPDTAVRIGFELLNDPVRLVRADAARALAPLVPMEANIPGRASPLRAALDPVLQEYRETQLANADRPEAQMNLGLLEVALRNADPAEQHYRKALALDADFIPAYVNLADLYRAVGRDEDGRAVLDDGLRRAPDNPDLLHALGLLEVRAKNLDAALHALRRAAELAPDHARYAYVFALAQQAAGDLPAALATLRDARERHPEDRDIAFAAITLNADAGNRAAAVAAAEAYLQDHPGDTQAKAMLDQLRAAQ